MFVRARLEKFLADGKLHAERAGRRGHGFADNEPRRLQKFFQQHGRDGLHVANVIEAIPDGVGGQRGGRVIIKPHEIADGIAIFCAVETANGDAAWIKIFWINVKRRKLDPLVEDLLFLRRQARMFFRRRHEAGARVLEHLEPQLRVVEDLVGVGQRVKREICAAFAVAVAVIAIFLQDRFNLPVKLRQRRVLGQSHGSRRPRRLRPLGIGGGGPDQSDHQAKAKHQAGRIFFHCNNLKL